jgi:ribosomal protein L34E
MVEQREIYHHCEDIGKSLERINQVRGDEVMRELEKKQKSPQPKKK